MGVGEGWVNLNRPRVALHRSVHVLHFLEGVPHVAVGVRKVGVDPYGFLVVTQGLLEPTLHLQDAGQVGVGGSKLGVNLRGVCNVVDTSTSHAVYVSVWRSYAHPHPHSHTSPTHTYTPTRAHLPPTTTPIHPHPHTPHIHPHPHTSTHTLPSTHTHPPPTHTLSPLQPTSSAFL